MGIQRLALGGLALGAAAAGVIEGRYRRHPGNDITVAEEGWTSGRTDDRHLEARGTLVVRNGIPTREVMLMGVQPQVTLLSTAALGDLAVRTQVRSHRADYPARPDGYWTSYVVKPGRYGHVSPFEVEVEVTGSPAPLDSLYALWIEVRLQTYGFEGRRDQFHHVVVPVSFPDPADNLPWRPAADGAAKVKPLRTHLLGPSDDPVEVVRRYAVPHSMPGDIVTLGETPLAVMQRRFVDPRQLRRTWAATRLAQFMHGEGALGTAGGMQALMDETGGPRVAAALAGGLVGKAAGQDGWFYRLVGPQGRLVDDVTGTLPPYDNFVVLGPEGADGVCARITQATGLAAAIVDANDLGKVDVVGGSAGVAHDVVREALRSNPAGNAEETTPLVLIRPTDRTRSQADVEEGVRP